MGTPLAIDDIEYVLYGHKVSTNGFDPTEWLVVVRHILDRYKPYAKYLPAIHEPAKALSSMSDFEPISAPLSEHVTLVFLPPHDLSVNASVRLLPMAAVQSASTEGEEEEVTETYLFLTDKFEWVLLERKAGRESYRGRSWLSNKQFTFRHLSVAQLLEVVGDRHHIWPRILKSLQRLVTQAIKDKEERLCKLRAAVSDVDAMLDRVTDK